MTKKNENITVGLVGCGHPGCSIVKVNKKWAFQVEGRKDRLLDVPLCAYHYYLYAGNHFVVQIVKKGEYKIVGPHKEVSLIEQVMSAREMSKIEMEGKV